MCCNELIELRTSNKLFNHLFIFKNSSFCNTLSIYDKVLLINNIEYSLFEFFNLDITSLCTSYENYFEEDFFEVYDIFYQWVFAVDGFKNGNKDFKFAKNSLFNNCKELVQEGNYDFFYDFNTNESTNLFPLCLYLVCSNKLIEFTDKFKTEISNYFINKFSKKDMYLNNIIDLKKDVFLHTSSISNFEYKITTPDFIQTKEILHKCFDEYNKEFSTFISNEDKLVLSISFTDYQFLPILDNSIYENCFSKIFTNSFKTDFIKKCIDNFFKHKKEIELSNELYFNSNLNGFLFKKIYIDLLSSCKSSKDIYRFVIGYIDNFDVECEKSYDNLIKIFDICYRVIIEKDIYVSKYFKKFLFMNAIKYPNFVDEPLFSLINDKELFINFNNSMFDNKNCLFVAFYFNFKNRKKVLNKFENNRKLNFNTIPFLITYSNNVFKNCKKHKKFITYLRYFNNCDIIFSQ